MTLPPPSLIPPPQGYVYVPEGKDDMILSLVCNKFRARVSEELVVSHVTSYIISFDQLHVM